MKTVCTILAMVFSTFIVTGCTGDKAAGPGESNVSACVDRGVAYFKEIGSYPTLTSPPNSGRSAEDVASERCNRTTTAF